MEVRAERANATVWVHSAEIEALYDGHHASDISGATFLVNNRVTNPNPEISFFEMTFCRGRQIANSCSRKSYHPYFRWWEDWSDDANTDVNLKTDAVTVLSRTFGVPGQGNIDTHLDQSGPHQIISSTEAFPSLSERIANKIGEN